MTTQLVNSAFKDALCNNYLAGTGPSLHILGFDLGEEENLNQDNSVVSSSFLTRQQERASRLAPLFLPPVKPTQTAPENIAIQMVANHLHIPVEDLCSMFKLPITKGQGIQHLEKLKVLFVQKTDFLTANQFGSLEKQPGFSLIDFPLAPLIPETKAPPLYSAPICFRDVGTSLPFDEVITNKYKRKQLKSFFHNLELDMDRGREKSEQGRHPNPIRCLQ